MHLAFALRATHIYSSTPAKPNPEFWIPRKLGHIDTNPLVANQFLKRRKQEKKGVRAKRKNKTLWRILPSDHLAADSTARVRPPNAPEPTENRYLAKPVYFTAIFSFTNTPSVIVVAALAHPLQAQVQIQLDRDYPPPPAAD
ncbi:hypothetical protein MCOR30_002014 [Pyricularia oryzae]|nr:hypothetical protein MCOR30_002014 [Pyricularia oryzae]KAI6399905.1 hypothetical protein MCOR24_008696 [Pyricularia oryzae]